MAKKEEPVNFGALTAELRKNGPERLYLLWGPEDYLRERFTDAVKAACLPGGEDDFSYRLINGPELDVLEVKEAVDSVPFMAMSREKYTISVLKKLSPIHAPPFRYILCRRAAV